MHDAFAARLPFCGSVGKNAVAEGESVVLQLLNLLLLMSLLVELLRGTRRARSRGEEVITNARRHAEQTVSRAWPLMQ